MTSLGSLFSNDPVGSYFIGEFEKREKKKRDFIEHLRQSLPPAVWGALGSFITETVASASPGNIDQVFAFVEKVIDDFKKNGRPPEAAHLPPDQHTSAEPVDPIDKALGQVERFLDNARPLT